MKNIHILQTDKPSRIYTNLGQLFLEQEYSTSKGESLNQNIYITSDEEIKEKDWVCHSNKKIIFQVNSNKAYSGTQNVTLVFAQKYDTCKKIILTTDQDLIQDGVQAIDDEFLEWFVKNPNCEGVEIEKISVMNDRFKLGYKIIIPKEEVVSDYDVMSNIVYGENVGERIKIKAKIISKEESKPFKNMLPLTKIDWEKFKKNPIPSKKEEPKQETLEEAVQKVANSDDFINGALFGSLWQQERMYSEEEVEDLIYKVCGTVARLQGITLNGNHIDTAYKQFKKK